MLKFYSLRNSDNADLTDANLSRAFLMGADLTRANLGGADLTSIDLSEADLSGANLSQADLSNWKSKEESGNLMSPLESERSTLHFRKIGLDQGMFCTFC